MMGKIMRGRLFAFLRGHLFFSEGTPHCPQCPQCNLIGGLLVLVHTLPACAPAPLAQSAIVKLWMLLRAWLSLSSHLIFRLLRRNSLSRFRPMIRLVYNYKTTRGLSGHIRQHRFSKCNYTNPMRQAYNCRQPLLCCQVLRCCMRFISIQGEENAQQCSSLFPHNGNIDNKMAPRSKCPNTARSLAASRNLDAVMAIPQSWVAVTVTSWSLELWLVALPLR